MRSRWLLVLSLSGIWLACAQPRPVTENAAAAPPPETLEDGGVGPSVVATHQIREAPDLAAARGAVLKIVARDNPLATREELQALGPKCPEVLFWLYQDANADTRTRTLGLQLMAILGDDVSRSRLADIVKTGKVELTYLKAAMEAYASVGGKDAVTLLAPLLDDALPDIREAAARALGKAPASEAKGTLQKRLAIEKDGQVRKAIEGALRQQ